MRVRETVLSDYVEASERDMKKVAFGAGSCMAWYQVRCNTSSRTVMNNFSYIYFTFVQNSRGVNWVLYPKDLVRIVYTKNQSKLSLTKVGCSFLRADLFLVGDALG